MPKVVGAFFGCKCLDEYPNELPERLDCKCSAFAQYGLELGESLFDRVEVRGVRRDATGSGLWLRLNAVACVPHLNGEMRE
jgi:hypothetical protein